MNIILAIACGGAMGAVLRHVMTSRLTHLWGPGFPYGTLCVNLLGSFLMGVLVAALARYADSMWSDSIAMKSFLTVGLLGGFTTFSAFSLDVMNMIERGETNLAVGYIVLSVFGAVLGLWIGLQVVRWVTGP